MTTKALRGHIEFANVSFEYPRFSGMQGFHFSRANPVNRPDFGVLSRVSFRVNAGEVVGVIGRNGSGKSTLLKLAAGIYTPTEGHVLVEGRIAPMIELGAGFSPELTVKENIVLYGSLLGISSRVCRQQIPEILEWAQLQERASWPLRSLSSGMTARLAFSIATTFEPDVLLVDEVLSVGDAAFQERSASRLEGMIKQGAAVVLVSHSVEAIKALCHRAIWLEGGSVVQDGDPREVLLAYINHLRREEGLYEVVEI